MPVISAITGTDSGGHIPMADAIRQRPIRQWAASIVDVDVDVIDHIVVVLRFRPVGDLLVVQVVVAETSGQVLGSVSVAENRHHVVA